MELAKDGRWMGGVTPTGFSSKRISTGSGKNKSAVSFLVPIPEERRLVERLFDTFLATRSIYATATALKKEYTTKNEAEFTSLAVRDILKNPIYCTADEQSYQYFMDQGANLFGEPEDFDGVHGISAYNKTDQMILEDENSTFFNPKFVHAMERKPIEQWIVSVGQHDGYISSEKWISAQKLLSAIAERHNRPHRKTNALLSGVLRCPLCGRPLRVVPESNRWTNGKPRFKYSDLIGTADYISICAILIPAVSRLRDCGGFGNAIHSAAGLQLRDECSRLMTAQGHPEPNGRAKLTRGYNLPARYVLHTVGPIVQGRVRERDRAELASCYRSCLKLAAENGLESIAFCCVSTGVFHFPNQEAAEIAVSTVTDFLQTPSSIKRVIFNVFKDTDAEIYRNLLGADRAPEAL